MEGWDCPCKDRTQLNASKNGGQLRSARVNYPSYRMPSCSYYSREQRSPIHETQSEAEQEKDRIFTIGFLKWGTLVEATDFVNETLKSRSGS